MLTLRDVTYHVNKKTKLIHQLSGTVSEGDRLILFGPNGAGKSTLLRIMAGLVSPTAGEIDKADSLAERNSVGYVPQQIALFQNLTVRDHIRFYKKMTGGGNEEFIDEMIQTLDLEGMYAKRIDELSGGMQRKVNLAVGLIHNPKIIFLDEPFVGVDLASKHDILTWLNTLNREKNTTIVFVSHEWDVIEQLGNTMWLMEAGKLLKTVAVKGILHENLAIPEASPQLNKMLSFATNKE